MILKRLFENRHCLKEFPADSLHTKKKKFDFTLLRVLRTLPPRGRFLKSRAEPLSKGADKHSLHPMGTHWSSGLNP